MLAVPGSVDEGLEDLDREQKQQLLGLFGWNLRVPAPGTLSQPLLFCTMCGVKCGLWNFKPDETDPLPGWRPTSLAGVAATILHHTWLHTMMVLRELLIVWSEAYGVQQDSA